MSVNLNPRTVILQSNSNTNQYFYFFFMDVPASAYPLVQVTPTIDSDKKVVTYTNVNYNFPDDPDPGSLKTQALEPIAVTYAPGAAPTLEEVKYVGSNATKKGVVKGVKVARDWETFFDEQTTDLDYVCKNRSFVIQSETQANTYFVGTLVDFPANIEPAPPVGMEEHLVLPIGGNSNADQTYAMIIYNPSTYDGSASPKIATFKSIHVANYGDETYRGIFLNDTNIDLFATPLIPDTQATNPD